MKNIMVVPIFLAVVVAQVDYDTEIQPIWNSNCASCHTSTHSSGLNLTSGNSFDGLVDVTSTNYSPALRVASGDPGSSVLYDKITGGGSYGGQMPPYGAGGLMSEANRSLVQTWITELSSANYITIAAARAEGDGASVTVRGMVTTPNYQTDHTEYGLQDGTGGLVIFHYGSPYVTLAVGDSVEVSGTLDEYNGKLEVIPENADDITVISSNNSLPAFQVLTVANFVANGGDYESELIRINSTSITSGTWPTSSSANLTISDDGGTSTVIMRIDSDMDIIGNPEPADPFNVQGIIGQYNDYQILPRYYTDFSSPAPTIADITMDPTSPTDEDNVTISATVTDDSTVASVTLTYDVGSGDTTVAMSNTTGDTYAGTIPAQSSGTIVIYTITAADNSGNSTESDEGTYTVLPSGIVITSIYDIQYVSDPTTDDASPLDGQTVTISGVVTAEFWGSSSNPVSYTHLTLPTILLV